MTVSKDEQFVYNWFGDGKNTTFDFDFLIENESQLAVYFTNTETSQIKLENGIDYSINEIGNENGSFITFPIEGSNYNILKRDEIISISLELPISQDTPYDESGKLVKSRLERNFDYLTKLLAIQSKQIERAVKIREGSQYNPNEVLSIIFESEEKSKLAKENSQVALDSANLAKDIATAAQNQSNLAIVTAENSNNTALVANENSTNALTNANQALNIAINANHESQEAIELANITAQKVDIFEQDIQTVIDAASQVAQLEESVTTAISASSVATNAANEASVAAKNATNAADNATQAVEDALATTQISLNNKLDVNGTALKAIADSNGNNIVATYRTISDSYTKTDVDALLEISADQIEEKLVDIQGGIGDIQVNKADTDFSNVTNEAKVLMSGMGMPINKYTNLTLGSSGATYTAPSNGWFYIRKAAGAAGNWLNMGVNPHYISCTAASSSTELSILYPVKQGYNVNVSYQATGTTGSFRFIYAEGSRSEV